MYKVKKINKHKHEAGTPLINVIEFQWNDSLKNIYTQEKSTWGKPL